MKTTDKNKGCFNAVIRSFWAALILIFTIIAAIFFFFFTTEAPILQGEVDLFIKYKDKLQLDIYEPKTKVYDKHPVLIYYHGGGWVGGNKITVNNARFHGVFNALREKGYFIISPEYTLAKYKASPFPACIADAFDVIAWIEENASTYNFDVDNIGVFGESAGGHLALMTAFADIEKFTESYNIDLDYVVGVYPPTDLDKLYADQSEMRELVKESTSSIPKAIQEFFDIDQYLFGFDSASDTVLAKTFTQLYSPINYVKTVLPNTLIIHGSEDRIVPISQSIILKEKMDSMETNLEFHVLEGVDHAFINATDDQKAQTQKWITEFILKQYVN